MKKILLLFLIFFSAQVYGQFWIDVAVRGGAGPNLMLNSNVFKDNDLIHKFAMGSHFGGKIGFNFGDIHSINLDVAKATFNQGFQNKANRLLQEQMEFSSLDLSIIYRKLSEGRYVEIGPSVVNIKADNFKSLNYAGVFGFGRTLAGSDRVAINLGFRVRYVFTDILEDAIGTESLFFGTDYIDNKITTPISGFLVLELEWAVGVFRRSTCYRNRLRFVTF